MIFSLPEDFAKILSILLQIQRSGSANRLVVSPRCVARLTCEIQKNYLSDVDKDTEILDTDRKLYLTNLYAFLSIYVNICLYKTVLIV